MEISYKLKNEGYESKCELVYALGKTWTPSNKSTHEKLQRYRSERRKMQMKVIHTE